MGRCTSASRAELQFPSTSRRIQNDFMGKLNISFSGGADAFNIIDILACGIKPITVSTDLLKPGGYGRLHQYYENLSGNK